MKTVRETMWAWIRGLVWTAMIFGCAWASAQSYLVTSANRRYQAVAIGAGDGVGLGQGVGAEGAQNTSTKDELFAGTEVFEKNATDVTEITMDPDTLNLVGGPDAHKARNTVLNVVRTYTYDKPGMYNMADVDAIRSKLNTGDWHCSVHIRDLKNGSGSDVCNKHRTDGLKETAIIEVEPKQLTFIHTIRREDAPGTSELGYFPVLRGLSGLPALAMIDPEALADMEIGLHGSPMVMPMVMPMMKVTPEIRENMNRVLKTPISPEQMQKLKDQYKDLYKNYKGYQDMYGKSPEAPTAPVAPNAPEIPGAVPAPTAPTAPTAPQTPQ